MKTKKMAKPVKGSARTKRFMDGGTVGALAGLGTLAYLMSRKKDKKDESPESGGMSRDPKSSTVMETLKKNAEDNANKPVENKPTNESSYAPESKFGAKDIGFGGGVDDGIRVSPKPAPKKVIKKAKGYNPPATDSSQPSADNETRPSKPYPVNSQPNEKRESKASPVTTPNEKRESKPYPEAQARQTKAALNQGTYFKDMTNPEGPPRVKAINDKDPKREYLRNMAREGRAREEALAKKRAAERKSSSEMNYDAMGNAYKKGGKVMKYAKGGMVRPEADGVAIKGKTQGDKRASGGSIKSRGDGCAQRGKTKGTMR
jgi:hypothetical protein